MSKPTTTELKETLNRVQMWVGNCDQKASFLLALLGVMITFLCTGKYVDKIRDVLIAPFVTYCNTGVGSFSVLRLILFVTI